MTQALHGKRALVTGASGGIGGAVARDLAAAGAGRALVEQVTAQAGPIDVLVANAGVGVRKTWDDVDDDLWDTTFAVNVTATWQLTRAAVPGMIERGFGRILYVSSIAALNGGIVGPHYAASKAALHGLMHHMAARVAGAGVTVNTIAPALIAGTRILPLGADGAPPVPIPGGHLGLPENIADMALAMLTNPYLTNKVITVDGGLYPA